MSVSASAPRRKRPLVEHAAQRRELIQQHALIRRNLGTGCEATLNQTQFFITMKINFHPLANIFPLLDGPAFDELIEDVRKYGVREPITLHEGLILDGRNRWRAAQDAGKTCPTREYEGDDPLKFVLSLNLKRRQLSAGQLAFVALEIEKIEAEMARKRMLAGVRVDPPARKPEGRIPPQESEVLLPEKSTPTISIWPLKTASARKTDHGEARVRAAEQVGVGARYVQDAKKIEATAPNLAAEVKSGSKTITQAMREVKEATREQRRDENRQLIALAPSPARTEARYATIVIDPPWDWGDEGDADQLGRARPTYGTMSFEQLLELPVAQIADIDCHLYLWITNRSLPKGFALMERWGFRYIVALTWCKSSFGMGNYFRGSTEHVLFGVRGSQPLRRKDVGTWFAAPRGPMGHSSKPVEFYPIVESCSPGPYLEMFARSERTGWQSWGAEANAA